MKNERRPRVCGAGAGSGDGVTGVESWESMQPRSESESESEERSRGWVAEGHAD